MAKNNLTPFKDIVLSLLLCTAQPAFCMDNEIKKDENNKVRPLPKFWTKDLQLIPKNKKNNHFVYVIDFLEVMISGKGIDPKDKLVKSTLQWKDGNRKEETCESISYGEGIIVTTNNPRLTLSLKWTLDIPEDQMKWVSRSTYVAQDLSRSTPIIEVRIDLPRAWFICESPPYEPIVKIYNN